MIGFLIALVSGALMSIQGVFNTQVTKSTGIWTASAFVQFTVFYQEISDAVIHRSVIRIPTGPVTQDQKNGNQTDKKYSQQNTVYFFH